MWPRGWYDPRLNWQSRGNGHKKRGTYSPVCDRQTTRSSHISCICAWFNTQPENQFPRYLALCVLVRSRDSILSLSELLLGSNSGIKTEREIERGKINQYRYYFIHSMNDCINSSSNHYVPICTFFSDECVAHMPTTLTYQNSFPFSATQPRDPISQAYPNHWEFDSPTMIEKY